MIEAFDMFNSLNLARDLAPFIHLGKRRPQGTENLWIASCNQKQISNPIFILEIPGR